MRKVGVAKRCTLLLLCILVTLSACSPGPDVDKIPKHLAQELEGLTSYQLEFSLKQTDNQILAITQWYKKPASIRTDVSLQGGEVAYQFFFNEDRLLVRHLDLGYQEQLHLSNENALFTSPLLQELLRELQSAQWSFSEESAAYSGEFSWRDGGDLAKRGSVQLNDSFLPETVTFYFGETKVLDLCFENIIINPILADKIFQP